MSAGQSVARRALVALLATVLAASVLSSDSVLGQDGGQFPPIEVVPEAISATGNVTVLGDGFLAAPTIAPVRPDRCVTSTNGPVERATRRSEAPVAVNNQACVDATLFSIGLEQVPNIDDGDDLVVIGGIGLEFDWAALASQCLVHQTRSPGGCGAEASLARATAANSVFAWRALLQQVHTAAPNATIALVAPPVPVASTPLPLGSRCCAPQTDGHAQVRSVFDTAAVLRAAVVESVRPLPVVLVETSDAFEGHRMGDEDAWLTNGQFPGTPTVAGSDAIADLIDILIPEPAPIAQPPASPAEIALIVGTTADDRESLDALSAGAVDWIDTHLLSDINPTIAVVPLPTRERVPPTTTTTPAEAPVAAASAPIELDVEIEVEIGAEPVTVAQEPTTSGERLEAALSGLVTADGVTTISDLVDAIDRTVELFTPTVADRQIVVRAAALDLDEASDDDYERLQASIERSSATVTILAVDADRASILAERTADSGAIIDVASADDLATALPAPVPEPQLIALRTRDIDALLAEPATAVVEILARSPGEVTVTWSSENTVVSAGQRATIQPARLGIGVHLLTVTVSTRRETLAAEVLMRVTVDGDTDLQDECTAFNPIGGDTDGDGAADACDTDDDGDGIADEIDPCPTVPTANLTDIDLDGLPDNCDADPLDGPRGDTDGDGFPDLIDNCPAVPQADQFDADNDGIGNACEVLTPTICTIVGTSGDDVVRGTPGDDIICGFGGDDLLVGLGGDDILLGGAGNDTLVGSGGDDILLGGLGNDELRGNGNDDLLIGEGGEDRLFGGFGSDVISGGRGNDTADGEYGDDVIFGGRGDDLIRGGDGADTLDGEAGNDRILGEEGTDLIDGGPGADELLGGRANDRILGIGASDEVRGGLGDDVISATPLRVT